MTRQLLFPYLLNEQFEVGNRAPLDAVRAAQPGPGSLTLVQVDGEFSTSGGALNFPAQATPTWGDQGVRGVALTDAVGKALLASINFSAIASNGAMLLFNSVSDVNITSPVGATLWVVVGGTIHAYNGSVTISTIGNATVSAATNYRLAVIRRSAGVFLLIKGGAYSEWTLLWVHNTGTSATLYPVFTNWANAGALDNFRVVDLPLPWTDDYGIATQRLAGAVAAGTSFVHEANCIIEWTQTTRPSGDFTRVDFRRQDASNYWRLAINSIGDMDLREVVAGVPTTRGTSAGVVASGDRIVIVADGTTIRVYEANTLRITYSSATNFATATAGEINTLGTGGVVSELISWPRTLSGQALSTLERV